MSKLEAVDILSVLKRIENLERLTQGGGGKGSGGKVLGREDIGGVQCETFAGGAVLKIW